MTITLTINTIEYEFPEQYDEDWGPTVTAWAASVSNGLLQKSGGQFTLTNDVNFGTQFGLHGKYFTSTSLPAATAGTLRLENEGTLQWRNDDDTDNITLGVNTDGALLFEGVVISGGGNHSLMNNLDYDDANHTGFARDIAGGDSGCITGGVVTIGTLNTTFDVTAGTGIIKDWSDPANPVFSEVSWDAFTAESVPDINGSTFTSIYVKTDGTLLKQAGHFDTPQDRRVYIILQGVVHIGSIISVVGTTSQPGYEITQALLDYVLQNGSLNAGNAFGPMADENTLRLRKTIGTTTLPFINRLADPSSPTIKTNVGFDPVPFWIKYWQDGVGGFQVTVETGDMLPNEWDDGTGGTPALVGLNKWTNQRIYFFGQTDFVAVVLGQTVYNSETTAQAGIITEDPAINPTLGLATWNSVMTIKRNATDLSDVGDATFTEITSFNTAGQSISPVDSVFARTGSITALDSDYVNFPLLDGSRPFTGTVSGIAPTASGHLSTKGYVDDQWNKQFTMDHMVEQDNITIWRNKRNRTITELHTTFSGTGVAQADWSIFHGVDRLGSPTPGVELTTGGYTTGSGNPPQETFTSFTNPSISADEYVWMEVTTVTGVVLDFSLNFEGTEG